MMEAVEGNPFETWRRLRESQGDRVTIITLYAMVAGPRGLRAHELPLAERRALAARAISVVFPGWETEPGSDPRAEAVRVVPYDPAWPGRFEAWRDRLAGELGAIALRIEHVGSTAVPGLAAKPIADIQVSVANLDQENAYVPQCQAAGLQLRSRDREHRYFRPSASRPRDVHVHVCRGRRQLGTGAPAFPRLPARAPPCPGCLRRHEARGDGAVAGRPPRLHRGQERSHPGSARPG
jgi:hypothetical protein